MPSRDERSRGHAPHGEGPSLTPRPVTTPVTLRVADGDDIARMADIEARVFGDPWPRSAFRDLLGAPHAHIAVAERRVDDPIIGYCVLLHAADEGEIANIATEPSVRGQGVGAQLLDHALDTAQHYGVRAVYLEVRTSNGAARALYASRGFEVVGRRRAYYRNPLEDALVLRRDIPALA